MMPPPRTHRFRLILAAVDFSSQSAKAVRYAVALSRAGGGRVVAVHAIHPLLAGAAARAYDEPALVEDARADLVRFVRSAAGAEAASRIECLAIVGAPRHTLAATSRRLRADVLVMGTSGRSGAAKAFFGSVSQGLLRRYPGTMLIVPPGCPNPTASWPGQTVVAAVTPGEHRRGLIAAAGRMTAVLGAWLSVVDIGTAVPRSRASLILFPLAAADRLRTFRQGTTAYRFICDARRPVLVMHAGRRIGHIEGPRKAA